MILCIGSGGAPLADAVNVDWRFVPGVNVICDLNDSLPFADESFDEIVASDVLEHFPMAQTQVKLKDWIRTLHFYCPIRVRVPDLRHIARRLLDESIPDQTLIELIYGGQEYQGNFHLAGFTMYTLQRALLNAGCSQIRIETPTHHNINVTGVK